MLSEKDEVAQAPEHPCAFSPDSSDRQPAGPAPKPRRASIDPKLVDAERLAMLGRIVAGVAHEINNPLSSILAYAELIRRSCAAEDDGDPIQLEWLGRIEEAAHRVLKFSKDLVAYARPSGEISECLLLEDAINRALVFCEHEFARHRVAVEREFANPGLPVRGAGAQLTQVFVNLFSNAAQAMSATGGRLRVAVDAEPEHVRVEILDTGIGIEEGHLPLVFEPFFTTRPEGGGLGLAIVQEIVLAHGGQIELRSAPGKGTVCVVRLPLAHER
jgi:two-component system NtrC family sensor kinase